MFWIWHFIAIITIITLSFMIGYSVGKLKKWKIKK